MLIFSAIIERFWTSDYRKSKKSNWCYIICNVQSLTRVVALIVLLTRRVSRLLQVESASAAIRIYAPTSRTEADMWHVLGAWREVVELRLLLHRRVTSTAEILSWLHGRILKVRCYLGVQDAFPWRQDLRHQQSRSTWKRKVQKNGANWIKCMNIKVWHHNVFIGRMPFFRHSRALFSQKDVKCSRLTSHMNLRTLLNTMHKQPKIIFIHNIPKLRRTVQ